MNPGLLPQKCGGQVNMKKNFFTFKKVNDRITSIWSACGEIMYLIEGDDRALLMDTNLGVRGLRALVDSLTGLPYDVVITHGHIDHAMGAPEFRDKKVYLNAKDIPVYQSMCPVDGRDGYVRANLGPAYSQYGLTKDDYLPAEPDFPFLALEEGMVFDLGGVQVQIYAYPGHTKGSMILYIPQLRTLITGDACNNSTFIFDANSTSLEEYRDNTIRIRDLFSGKLDHIYICHHEMEVSTDLLSNMADVCEEALEGRADDVPYEFMGQKAWIAKKADDHFHRLDGRSGNIIYSKEHLWK